MHVLVIGQDSFTFGTKEVVVPDTENGQDDGNVVLEWSVQKVLVHLVSTAEELLKVIKANVDGNRQANGRPERVTATNPVPELEHVLWVNAKRRDGGGVGGQGNKVLCDVGDL